jgi:hypothetical protein
MSVKLNNTAAKSLEDIWPWWLTKAASFDVPFIPEGKHIDSVIEAMKRPYSFYGTLICFQLLQPDRREALGVGPLDTDELVALNSIVFGGCKSAAECDDRYDALLVEQLDWDKRFYSARGSRLGTS